MVHDICFLSHHDWSVGWVVFSFHIVFSGLGCFAWISAPTRTPCGGPVGFLTRERRGRGSRYPVFFVWCVGACVLIGYASSNDNNNERAGGGMEELGGGTVGSLLLTILSLGFRLQKKDTRMDI